MGFGETIQGRGSVAWPGEIGLHDAKPRSAESHLRSYDPTCARTPKEALTYIELLYKSGRMEDLATLLRRSQVFREAWLMVQQSSPGGFEAEEVVKGSWHQEGTRGLDNFPVPETGSPGFTCNQRPESGGLEAAEMGSPRRISGLLLDRGAENCPATAPACKPDHPFTALLQVYQNQDLYYTQEKVLMQRISIRV